jgi:phosphate transport system substrate-binding protein
MKSVYLFIVVFVLAVTSCDDDSKNKNLIRDSPRQGTIYISVDESFKPVIEEQIKVYQSSYPETHIIASYKSEVDCFRDLQKDSTRMIIVARGLKKDENDFFQNQLSFRPQYDDVAYDAVAVIVNIKNKDSVFTLQQLKDIVTGKKDITVVMDGNNATSTVRYLQDSLLRGAAFGKNVVAAKGSEDVVTAVSQNEAAIGFVGLSWVGDSYDKKQQENLKKVRMCLLECTTCGEKGYFAKPSQATITYMQYPLARPLYCIVKENGTGLGTGFMNFMSLERGQLVFRRAFLAPAKMNLNKRKVI